jgi:hypothetical protein
LIASVSAGSGLQEVFAPAALLNALDFCDRRPGGRTQVLLSMLTIAKGSRRFD